MFDIYFLYVATILIAFFPALTYFIYYWFSDLYSPPSPPSVGPNDQFFVSLKIS